MVCAVVTGASSGMGRAVASALAARGERVIAVGRDAGRLASALSDVPDWIPCVLDLSQPFETLPDAFPDIPVDHLIHCAGSIALGEVATSAVADFDAQMLVNTRAPWMLSRLLLPRLIDSGGQIVFVNSSIALQTARAGHSAYAASKSALKAVADALRDEVNGLGVRVTSVYPGRTASSMQAELHQQEGKSYQPERLMQPEDVAATILHALDLPRTAEITDLSMRPFLKG